MFFKKLNRELVRPFSLSLVCCIMKLPKFKCSPVSKLRLPLLPAWPLYPCSPGGLMALWLSDTQVQTVCSRLGSRHGQGNARVSKLRPSCL